MTVAPAHSLDAEASVLGSILLSPARSLGPVRELLRPADFFAPQHVETFTAMLELAAAGRPIDVLTLAEALERRGTLQRYGGAEFLGELAGRVATVENVAHHARIVSQKAITRAVKRAAAEVAASSSEGEELLQEALREFGAVQLPQLSQGSLLRDELLPALSAAEKLAGQELLGLRTYLADLDEMMSGIQPGVMTLVGARPSMGKSSLVALWAQNVAEHGGVVDFYSLEDTKRSLTLRMLAQRAQVSNQRLRGGRLNATEWAAVQQAAGTLHSFGERLMIWDDLPRDAGMFCTSVQQAALRRKTSLIVVDYIQLLTLPSSGERRSRNEELGAISRDLKRIPKECDCAIVVCCQLSRDTEKDGSPQLHHLRDSGTLEQDAEAVVLLDRPKWLTDADGKTIPAAFAHIRKNKNAGTGSVALSWRGEYVLFGDADEETRRMAWAASRSQKKARPR